MKIIATGIALCLLSSSAFAQARPEISTMSCSAAAAMVSSRGAVVASTGPNSFERLVSHAGYCTRGERTVPFFTRTKDNAACMVGYECRDQADWDPNK